jgi:hypothetical protein
MWSLAFDRKASRAVPWAYVASLARRSWVMRLQICAMLAAVVGFPIAVTLNPAAAPVVLWPLGLVVTAGLAASTIAREASEWSAERRHKREMKQSAEAQ